MKNLTNARPLMAGLMALTCLYACKKDQLSSADFVVHQTNLVSDTAGFGAERIDSSLVNAWGLAYVPGGPIWISANGKGLSVIYNNSGQTLRPPVTIPSRGPSRPGAPSGVIFNSSPTNFGGNKFLFASEDGIILGWSSGNAAVKVADRSASGAVYKGIVMANDGSGPFLCLTNFHAGTIDVFDANFNFVTTKPFHDPDMPADFAPFNIQLIGGQLFVTFAKQKAPDNHDDQAGPGNGFVDIFKTDGTFVKRFASRGTLNSPWGIALVPGGFADNEQAILIGNFGDGRINVFDMQGNFKGQLHEDGHPVTIDGLWAIDFLNNNQPAGNANNPLYFTAGPDSESHGLFGKLQR